MLSADAVLARASYGSVDTVLSAVAVPYTGGVAESAERMIVNSVS
jgi:hypothetical protein